ncbi:MAG: heat-inducible transcription repressor HrcA [Candidatus Eisenbacteria bacterium]|nr:heat-inducible transcription repressor HrcA [Candidatus Eisenbacteria bacterium]
MRISDREETILRAVIDSYVASARPVSSSAVVRGSSVSLSSATVRNVMRALEEKGLILQPHTSAGRVPTDMGYRYYVDNLVRPAGLSAKEADSIRSELTRLAHRDLSGVLAGVSHLVSELSRELAVAVAPSGGGQLIDRVELIDVGGGRILAVVSTDAGPTRTATITAARPPEHNELQRASGLITEWTCGVRMSDASGVLASRSKSSDVVIDDQLDRLIEGVRSCLEPGGDRSVHYDGARYMFRHPEFSSDASHLGEILDSDEALAEVVRGPDTIGSVRVVIGHENVRTGMERMSLVAGTYRIGGSAARMGVIGPTRMKYSRLMSLVRHLARALDELFADTGP